jgi:hypothetical protein
MRNEEVNLLLKGNFKRLSVCDKFGEIRWKVKTWNLQFTQVPKHAKAAFIEKWKHEIYDF